MEVIAGELTVGLLAFNREPTGGMVRRLPLLYGLGILLFISPHTV